MSYLSMMEATLPPGFRFHPRDEELVCDYLSKKLHDACTPLMDVDLNKCEPWDLPDTARVGGREWYFFNLRDRKYATGQRTNRATISGYWKATGKDRHVRRGEVLVGMRKMLVFYQGRAPKGRKTDWVMHEFRVEQRSNDASKHRAQEDWVLCRVFYKSRRGLSSSSSKPIKMHGTVVSYEDDNTLSSASSSSLPTFITFNNYTVGCFEGYNHQQVPCFSNDPPTSLPTIKDHRDSNHFGGPININDAFSSGLDHLNQLDVDQKVMREVLNQLARLEGGGPLPGHLVGGGGGSLAIGRSGYLSGNAGISSSMW